YIQKTLQSNNFYANYSYERWKVGEILGFILFLLFRVSGFLVTMLYSSRTFSCSSRSFLCFSRTFSCSSQTFLCCYESFLCFSVYSFAILCGKTKRHRCILQSINPWHISIFAHLHIR